MLNEDFINKLSKQKKEPQWMKNIRLKAYKAFKNFAEPNFGPKLAIDFSKIIYYKNDTNGLVSNWDEVNCQIKKTFNDLGVIRAEEKYLAGVTNQYESEVIYHKNKTSQDIIFTSTDDALKKYPELVKKYFNNLVKYDENKYTALNTAVWSGGSFIYIPPYTKLDRPLQSYFRIETNHLGQFERTIIIVDEGASLEYIEGCTAKTNKIGSLHAGIVEIYVGKNASCKYMTIQNWSKDVYNLVTKRALVLENGQMAWIDGNLGSFKTMKYPSCILKGDNSKGSSLSIAYAKKGQVIDAGAKMIHIGKNTKSNILSKSIAQDGGVCNYRGIVKITKTALNSRSRIKCDSIIMDSRSQSDTIPTNIVANDTSYIEHEATVSKVSAAKLFYLESKGLSEKKAQDLIVLGFISDFKKSIPLEYAVELNRLLKE